MKIIKARRAVATSNDKEKWPKCSLCNNSQISMNYNSDRKLVCNECIDKDGEREYVEDN